MEHLSGVSETMLITLYARAIETESKDPMIRDTKAVEITEQLNKRLSGSPRRLHQNLVRGNLPPRLAVTLSLRARCNDRYAMAFLEQAPDGMITSLGCGLDTRSIRCDNGSALWFDLDLPEVIDIRKQFIEETGRRRTIARSVTDFGWMDALQTEGRKRCLFIAEGLFMYLHESEVRALLLELTDRFPGSELVCEVVSSGMIYLTKSAPWRRALQRKLHLAEGVTFSFGMQNSRHFETWDPRIRFLDEWTYYDDREPKLGWVRVFGRIPALRYMQWTVHYRLGDSVTP